MLPKESWLATRKIQEDWPVHGLFERLHLDNAKEFHSEALRRGCEQYGIAIPRNTGLVGPVNAALRSLLDDGSVEALARQWLTFDPARARVLG